MHRIADRIIILWGWRRFVAALLAGALSALAMAPFDAFPVLWLTLPVFVWLIDGAVPHGDAGPVRRLLPAAIVGWTFGFGYFLAGLWWVGTAFLVDADRFAWLMPLAVVILPAGLALFWMLGAVVARLLWPDGWPRILVFAVVMAGAEWLRGHLFTGFPWNAAGYALAPVPVLMQSASLVGLWGLTLAAFFVFAAPAALATMRRRERRGPLVLAAFALLLLALHVGFGLVRLSLAEPAAVAGVKLRIVQPSIPQGEKWETANEDDIVRQYLKLSDGSGGTGGIGPVTHVIWPESAFPFLLTDRPDVLAAIGALLPPGTTLITGAARADPASDPSADRVFNSVYVIGDTGEILSAYDKVDLVPFGEFLPLRSFFESLGIRQLIRLPGGFTAGTRRHTLEVPDAPPMGPLICWEIIFPGAVGDPAERPAWLLNLTNDTWFGDTPGPRQHLLQAEVRAVEEGLPVVRAANSGISAIIDPYGRIEKSLGLGVTGILDGTLPQALPTTTYARYGDAPFLALLGVFAAISAAGVLVRRAKRN
ncbi:MAG: apolipoprotein N-acyltransferase [Rhizobiales bacterium]|nr:apolipoprotein N-acyltransferase [Hyphomicrobiales bacterium]